MHVSGISSLSALALTAHGWRPHV